MEQVTLHGKHIKEGDKVWDNRFGWTTVKNIRPDRKYKISTGYYSYMQDGKAIEQNEFPSLFWKEQKFDLTKPIPDLKVDDPIIVWHDERIKYKRYFCNFDKSGNVVTYDYGGTSWSVPGKTSHWPNWELPNES